MSLVSHIRSHWMEIYFHHYAVYITDTLQEKIDPYQWIPPIKDQWSGPRLNIKTVLSTYGDFHVKDKTAVRTSYL